MEQEKINEIKNALENMSKDLHDRFAYRYEVKDKEKFGVILYADILTLINELESENKQLKDRLAEVEDKIENGTLVEFPCKVGQKIYYVEKYAKNIYDVEVGHISMIWLHLSGAITYEVARESGSIDTEEGTLLSNGFYLTKAEAEAKLKELLDAKGEIIE